MRDTNPGQHGLRGRVSFNGLPGLAKKLTVSIDSSPVGYVTQIGSYRYEDRLDGGKGSRREGKCCEIDAVCSPGHE